MDVNVAEKVKHGLAAGTASAPQRPDWTVDQGWENYTPAQHAVWKTLYERQTKLLPGLACDDFVAGMKHLPMSAERIPNFEALSETLMKATGWQVVAVPGLVPDDVFFDHLANRRFPSGNFIRGAHELDYLEEPDVFHDVFGHVPMLMHPVGPRVLVHGGVWSGAPKRRLAYLRCRDCIVVFRERVFDPERFAQPHWL